jgi:hypothetical protein
MVHPDNHYERAFEGYLRWLKLPHLPVWEARRALLRGRTLKNFDFLVWQPGETTRWLVEVKGRQFPTGGKQYWRNWSTTDELESLAAWEAALGPAARAVLVFAYQVVGDKAPLPPEELFVWQGGLYGFVGIWLAHYQAFARPLSQRWKTVTLPSTLFRTLARPVHRLFRPNRPVPPSTDPPSGTGEATEAAYA